MSKHNVIDSGGTETMANKIFTKLKSILSGYVPTSRKINNKPLTGDVTLNKSDVGLGNVSNSADSEKSVKYAKTAGDSTAITLSAANWKGTAAPYSYDLGSTYADKNVVIGFNGDKGTSAQLAAAVAANIQGGSGTKIYALEGKPTVDIPVILMW